MKLVSAIVFLSVIPTLANATSPAWAPCGGANDKLWSWAWVGDNGEYVTTETGSKSGVQRVIRMEDLSGNNHFYYQDDGEHEPYYDSAGVYKSGDWGSYNSTRIPLMRDRLFNGTNVYTQNMNQNGSLDSSNEFYLGFAGMNIRAEGNRDMWGRSVDNYVMLEQGTGRLRLFLAGNEQTITNSGAVPKGPILVEIWRDTNNVIHVKVNGQDVGIGRIMSGTFAMSGIGWKGTGSSGWDDYSFEYIVCDSYPTAQQREEVREYLRAKWNLYGEVAAPVALPLPPKDVKVD